MPGRIVLYGATGYTGALTAQAMVASGARPVLAGRDQSRLTALAARLGAGGRWDRVGNSGRDSRKRPGSLRDLIGAGDVLVSTAGPFMKVGRPVVAAAVDAGAVYLDSTGEPPFIRQVFEEFGPLAQRTGAVLLTAFGYDYVPGNLAGALALEAAGPGAARVQVGYFVRGDLRRGASAGTRASMIGMLLEPGYGFHGGRIVTEPTAAHIASFMVDGTKREAYSLGSSEHLRAAATTAGGGGPRSRDRQRSPTWASTSAGSAGRQGSSTTAPRSRRRSAACPGRAGLSTPRRGGSSAAGPRLAPATAIRSDVVAVARDASGSGTGHGAPGGRRSVLVHRVDPGLGGRQGGRRRRAPAGALGPVEAFGIDLLESACADAGFHRGRFSGASKRDPAASSICGQSRAATVRSG